MKPRPDESGFAQILVALDVCSDNVATMRAAAVLAALLRAELLGLFVEDADLLDAAQLPGAWEMMLWSARERQLTAGEMERSLRALAFRAQGELAEAATEARVRWSFRVVRGRRLQALMEASEEADVVFFGGARRGSQQRPRGRRLPDREHGVVLVYTGSAAADRGIRAAAAMASSLREQLTVLVVGADEPRGTELLGELERRLRERGVTAGVKHYPGSVEPRALVLKLVAIAGGGLVLPVDAEPCRDPGLLQVLLAAVSCPVILVR